METEHTKRAQEIAQEMIANFNYAEQNSMLQTIKEALLKDRADHMAQSKQAINDLKRLK